MTTLISEEESRTGAPYNSDTTGELYDEQMNNNDLTSEEHQKSTLHRKNNTFSISLESSSKEYSESDFLITNQDFIQLLYAEFSVDDLHIHPKDENMQKISNVNDIPANLDEFESSFPLKKKRTSNYAPTRYIIIMAISAKSHSEIYCETKT